jgi:predicted TIM-barrel fold metal-dependent hydrolase
MTNPWTPPLFDLHQHTRYYRRTDAHLLAHSRNLGVARTLLLPGAGWMIEGAPCGGNDTCRDLEAAHPGHFLRFTTADAAEPHATRILEADLQSGAIGIGEQKFGVPVDAPAMHRIYGVARAFRVPVLIHFEHEKYNLGIGNFEAILRAYPDVTFIGHAQTWWSNISKGGDPADLYPIGKVTPGGLTDRLLSDYGNLYGDLSAGSGLNALRRDAEFARGFLARHRRKLIWGSDCPCQDAAGAGWKQRTCIGRECLTKLQELCSDPLHFREIVWDNAARLFL